MQNPTTRSVNSIPSSALSTDLTGAKANFLAAFFKCQNLLAGLLAAAFLIHVPEAQATLKYWNGTGTWTTANTWGLASGGPYTQTWVAGDTAQFDVASSAITYVNGTVVAGITANQNVTVTAAGTFSTGATVMPINVASGMTFNFAAQNISTAVGTGISKSGLGALFMGNGNTYPGGFTLTAGSMIVGGVNAMGNGGALNINGGAIGADATRNITARYSGINVGGDFQLGVLATAVSVASSTANITFADNVALGSATRTITIGGNGIYTLSGVISGSPGVGLTVDKVAGTTGTLVLSAMNTYDGDTTLTGGILSLGLSTVNVGNNTGVIKLNGGNLAANSGTSRTLGNPITMAASSIISGLGTTGTRGSASPRYIALSTGTYVNTAGTLTIRNIGGATGTIFALRFLGGGFTFSRPIGIDSTGDAGVCQMECFGTGADQIFSGVISGASGATGAILRSTTVAGTGGNTIFTAANTYTRGTWLAGGYIGFGIDSVGTPGALTSGPIGTGAFTINDDTTTGFFASGGARTVGNAITFGTLAHPLIINGANNLTLSGAAGLGTLGQVLQVDNTADTTFAGVISGGPVAGIGLTKSGAGRLILKGANTYTGDTIISNGIVLINNTSGSGTSTGSILVTNGGTLGGTGIISGAVTNSFGTTVQPGLGGTNTATLTINNALALRGNALFVLNRTNAQTASKITGLSAVNYGGTLTVTNVGPSLIAGDTFTLFSATAYAGSFTNVVLPALNVGLSWNTNNILVDGSISITGTPTSLALSSSANPSGYLDALTFTANVTPSVASGSVIFYNGATPFSTNALVGGSANSASISSVPRGTTTIAAVYTGDGIYLVSSNSLSQVVTNHPPVAGNATYPYFASLILKIKVSNLLTNVADTDVDTITLSSTSVSTNGITLDGSSVPGYLIYANANGVNDTFNYTVSDGAGGSATGLVTITTLSSVFGQNATVVVGGSSATVSFAGIPGYTYGVQRSTNVMGGWVTIWTTNLASSPLFNYTDTFGDLDAVPSSAYYRLQWNP